MLNKKLLLLVLFLGASTKIAKCPNEAGGGGIFRRAYNRTINFLLPQVPDGNQELEQYAYLDQNQIFYPDRIEAEPAQNTMVQTLTSGARVAGNAIATGAVAGWRGTEGARGATKQALASGAKATGRGIANGTIAAWQSTQGARDVAGRALASGATATLQYATDKKNALKDQLPEGGKAAVDAVCTAAPGVGAGLLATMAGFPGTGGLLIAGGVGYAAKDQIKKTGEAIAPFCAEIAVNGTRAAGRVATQAITGRVGPAEALHAIANMPTHDELLAVQELLGRDNSMRASHFNETIITLQLLAEKAPAGVDVQIIDYLRNFPFQDLIKARLAVDKLLEDDLLENLERLRGITEERIGSEELQRARDSEAMAALVDFFKFFKRRGRRRETPILARLFNMHNFEQLLPPAAAPRNRLEAFIRRHFPVEDPAAQIRATILNAEEFVLEDTPVATEAERTAVLRLRDAALTAILDVLDDPNLGDGPRATRAAGKVRTLGARLAAIEAQKAKLIYIPKAMEEAKGQMGNLFKTVFNKYTFATFGLVTGGSFVFLAAIHAPALMAFLIQEYGKRKIEDWFVNPGFITECDHKFIYKFFPLLKYIQRPHVPSFDEFVAPEVFKDRLKEFVEELKTIRSTKASTGMMTLFYGSYGVGKTYVSRIIARTAGYKYAIISASMIRENKNFARMLKSRLEWARKNKIILIIDEAEELFGKAPEKSEDRMVLNELIGLLGTPERRPHVILLTNYPEKINNAFAGSGGRINRYFEFPQPDLHTIEQMLTNMIKTSAKTMRVDAKELNIKDVAEIVSVRPGREVFDIVASACLQAKMQKQPLNPSHFKKAVEIRSKTQKAMKKFKLAAQQNAEAEPVVASAT